MALMPDQRYVSHEFTHLVGGGLRDRFTTPELQEQQYLLLVGILRQGELGRLFTGPGYVITLASKGGTRLSSNAKYSGQMVCFCDIPVEDLNLHMRKYSQFGLAFPKRFLIGKGATPAFYVSQESVVQNSWTISSMPEKSRPTISFKEAFDSYEDDWARLLSDLHSNRSDFTRNALVDQLAFLHVKLERLFHSQLKFFDSTKDEHHDDNYYMEREWRVMGTIPFTLGDVTRIIVPTSFPKRFRQEFPDYWAQLTFSGEPNA
jgi:hypothetical protein